MKAALEAIHRAGVPGVWAEVRDNGHVWQGAFGDVTPSSRHRIGSVTKTFTAAAIMLLVERGKIGLDMPVHGEASVRMLLNMTSGLADYRFLAFPSLVEGSAKSLDDNQFRHFYPRELIKLGVDAPAVEPGVYSNTGYLMLGRLIESVTGMTAERWITRNVIERAGLRNTMFPVGSRIVGPHAPMFEALFGLLDPPRDYSVYDMSWVGVAASLISTVEDLNLFFAALLDGKIVSPESLREMQKTGPVVAFDGSTVSYGLGLHEHNGCWGHDGSVWGAGTWSFHSADGKRQVSLAVNLQRWNNKAIDEALAEFQRLAVDGDRQPGV